MTDYEKIKSDLKSAPRRWLLTGAAGFIGSNILRELLELDQEVTGLDDLSTGREANLAAVQALAGEERWKRFRFVAGDIRDIALCRELTAGCDYVLHQAALGSVIRSVTDPLPTHQVNIDGFINMLMAARESQVKSFVYASSSSVYGDNADLPKVEDKTGNPLSPYAVSKKVNELYAGVFSGLYGMNTTGLRYFNVFGPGQNPEGAYAAVIPRWVNALLSGQPCTIFGDGSTSRDFCYVSNVVQANIRAAVITPPEPAARVFNIGAGKTTTLKQLFLMILEKVARIHGLQVDTKPALAPERPGDIRHSLADTTAAREAIGYSPSVGVEEGLELMIGSMGPGRA